MKKNGFTLAEVLITLAIIGVVATMTLPALLTNTGEQQYKTGLKKAINTLTEAAQMNLAIDGYDYSNLPTGYGNIAAKVTNADNEEVDVDNANSLIGLLDARVALDYTKTRASEVEDGKTSYANAIKCVNTTYGGEGGQTLYLKDGTAILLPSAGEITGKYDTMQSDGLVKGFIVIYDTNGAKAPNALSNCKGAVNGGQDDGVFSDDADPTEIPDACESKSDRVIKDQFAIWLRGNTAVPAGAAATWAYNN